MQQHGYSLLDLILTLSLCAIIASSLALNKSGIKRSARIEIQSLLSDIDTYAYLAIKHNTDYYIEFNQQHSSYRIFNKTHQNQINTIKQSSFPSGIKIASANFGTLTAHGNAIAEHTLIMRANASASPGSVSLKSDKNTCSIIQTLRGARRFTCINN